jgi:NAD+ diphosphatase
VTIGGEIAGAAKATTNGFQILGRLARFLTERRTRSRAAERGRRLLGVVEPELFSYRVAMHHPLYVRGEPHPDDLAAFTAVAGHALATTAAPDRLVPVDELRVDLEAGLVLIGSPEAEAVTRLAFGYRSNAAAGGMTYQDPSTKLPYRWEEDASRVAAQCGRYVIGRGLVRRPNWPIIDQTGPVERPVFPVVANNGLLYTDLLLVTRIPNFLTRAGCESGRSIVSIAGTHGVATRAVGLLVKDQAEIVRLPAMIDWKVCPRCGHGLTQVGSDKNPFVRCDECGFTKYANPLPTTIGLVRDGSRYLFVRRAREPELGKWDAVGGFLNPAESAEDCLRREAREELGCGVLDLVITGTYASVYGTTGLHTIGIAFTCRLPEGHTIELSYENDEYAWFDAGNLPPLAFADVTAAVRDVVARG